MSVVTGTRLGRQRRTSAGAGVLMVAPALIIVVLFLLIPILYTLRMSVAEGPGFTVGGYVGAEHYQHLLDDVKFADFSHFPPTGALFNSLTWMILAVPACILIGLAVALAADRSRLQSIIRGAFFLPMVLSGTVLGVIWLFVYAPSPDVGLLNAALGTDQPWLGDPNTVNYALMATWVWSATGLSVVIVAAALKGVPSDIVEAAKVDGASGWRLFWHVTLPSIRLPLSFLLTTQLVQVLKVFDVVYVMTGGGPAGRSRTLALLFFQQSFESLKPQYGAAIVVVMSALIVIGFGLARRTGGIEHHA